MEVDKFKHHTLKLDIILVCTRKCSFLLVCVLDNTCFSTCTFVLNLDE